MKVIFVNAYHRKGGAARAARRLADALLLRDIEVEYLSVYPVEMSFIFKLRYFFRVLYDRMPGIMRAKKKIMFSSGGLSNEKIVSYINSSGADIVHFHWVNAGALSLDNIFEVAKPVFWSLHDMWPLTGGCHYNNDCSGFLKSCGNCPQLNSNSSKDISYDLFSRKIQHYKSAKNISLLGVSNWISSVARKSLVATGTPVITLPNAIDTDVFFPEPKEISRRFLGLDASKKIILFGAFAATSDPRKGFIELCSALKNLPDSLDYQLVVFGADSLGGAVDTGRSVVYLGHISDDSRLRAIYSSADVMVVPSRQETFGLTAAESMACGTPVVCFAVTGLLDIVDHKVNGFAARPFDPLDLASGICWVLDNSIEKMLALESRNKIVSSFGYKVVADKCIAIYKQKLKLDGDVL